MRQLLIVCTANICRSPMAAALIQDRLDKAGLADQVSVRSAGVFAQPGYAAAPAMVSRLAARNLDISQHSSAPLTSSDIASADLIVVMEEAHRQAIFYRAPHLLYKVFRLSELAGKHVDLADPYGGPEEGYDRAIALADQYLEAGWPQLLSKLSVPV